MKPRPVNWNRNGLYLSASGERSKKAKLTNAQAIEIVERSINGDCQSDLAREYGVSRNAIWNLLNGRAWSRVLMRQAIVNNSVNKFSKKKVASRAVRV